MTPPTIMPTREDIMDLRVGDKAMDCFGNMAEITSIFAGPRKNDKGRYFVCFYTKFGDNGEMSGSYVENEILRTVPLCQKYTSAEIDKMEQRALTLRPVINPSRLIQTLLLENFLSEHR